jgi:hypothetical protein
MSTPKEISIPFRPIPLEIPEGMKPNEFFNSVENLNDLVNNNGLLSNEDNLLLYRKALGHSNVFDCSIMYNTSNDILNPLGRPVRRTQINDKVKRTWNRMNQVLLNFMLEKYPDPDKYLILAGEASLDATWPLTSAGVPSIRMLHNHFIVFDKENLKQAKVADLNNPNLTDGGQNSLFQSHMSEVYQRFLDGLHLKILKPISANAASFAITGYPQGLPSWEITGGSESLKDIEFWEEYDKILKGFIDFYRTFFNNVSSKGAGIPKNSYYPELIDKVLLFDNEFLGATKTVRDKCKKEPQYANAVRWQPAFKQLIYRNDEGKLIVTISQNSIGNAITELLGIVVNRTPDKEAYEKTEPQLIKQLLSVRKRLIEADLGEGIATQYWGEK